MAGLLVANSRVPFDKVYEWASETFSGVREVIEANAASETPLGIIRAIVPELLENASEPLAEFLWQVGEWYMQNPDAGLNLPPQVVEVAIAYGALVTATAGAFWLGASMGKPVANAMSSTLENMATRLHEKAERILEQGALDEAFAAN